MKLNNQITFSAQKIFDKCETQKARLCIAAKTQSVESLKKSNINDRVIFAENRVQEAEEKINFYNTIPNELHFIGPLQKNKVRKAVQIFDMIHTVDSEELFRRIDRISGEEEKMVHVLLNINISEDPKKTGFSRDEITSFINNISTTPHQNIIISGVFTILQKDLPEEQISFFYALLHQIFTRLKKIFGPQFREISMGMSNDYPLALEQGSTLVRIGSGIFGKRPFISPPIPETIQQ